MLPTVGTRMLAAQKSRTHLRRAWLSGVSLFGEVEVGPILLERHRQPWLMFDSPQVA
jgi:hypothetical protein